MLYLVNGQLTYMLCCITRFEIYSGKNQHCVEADQTPDIKSGPAAVVRNMKAIRGDNPIKHHQVITDRFYSSLSLAVRLLSMKVYVLGICINNRYVVPYRFVILLRFDIEAMLYADWNSLKVFFHKEKNEMQTQHGEHIHWLSPNTFLCCNRQIGRTTNLFHSCALEEAVLLIALRYLSSLTNKFKCHTRSL